MRSPRVVEALFHVAPPYDHTGQPQVAGRQPSQMRRSRPAAGDRSTLLRAGGQPAGARTSMRWLLRGESNSRHHAMVHPVALDSIDPVFVPAAPATPP